jgi:hypothetical protein
VKKAYAKWELYLNKSEIRHQLKVEGSVRFLDGVKNCTDSVHKFSRAFLLCYEFVQFLTPSKNLTDPSTFTSQLKTRDSKDSAGAWFFYPRWYVCTTRVYVLLCCCSSWHGHINQNTALLSNFTMLSAYFCTIAYSLARQPCARLPGSLVRAAVQTSPNRFSRILHHIAPCFYEWVHSSQFTVHNEL